MWFPQGPGYVGKCMLLKHSHKPQGSFDYITSVVTFHLEIISFWLTLSLQYSVFTTYFDHRSSKTSSIIFILSNVRTEWFNPLIKCISVLRASNETGLTRTGYGYTGTEQITYISKNRLPSDSSRTDNVKIG
ncbi:hypothetical protein QVD17_27502 [Tagetes erecta]|uniref:Uncharacterized protein n=1 Tax=Tagetes erecta TaxID=13708 RepID=A0AAD8K8L9_TARER|nr:hypothetical protein QVD17_27502 [Tagetes erecta]